MKNARRKSLYTLVAAALLGVLVMPLAFAGAAKGPSKNAAVTAQIKKLNSRITALENRQTPAPSTTATPIGPAGGRPDRDLPEPDDRPERGQRPGGRGQLDRRHDVVTDSLGRGDLALDSVGGSEFKTLHAVVGTGVDVAANTAQNANVTCPAGEVIVGGGYAWQNDAGNPVDDRQRSERGQPERDLGRQGPVQREQPALRLGELPGRLGAESLRRRKPLVKWEGRR